MKLASIEKITEVRTHPNADRLDIVKVLGFQCVTEKGLYQPEEVVVYIQTDTLLPVEPWAEPYRKYSPDRVRAVKLRNAWSEGIILPLSVYHTIYNLRNPYEYYIPHDIGSDVSDILNVSKYEAPVPVEKGSIAMLPTNLPATGEDRHENILDGIPFGELVDVTLKEDGKSDSG